MLDSILALMPHSIKQILQKLPHSIKEEMEEIRIRTSRPLELVSQRWVKFVDSTSSVVKEVKHAYHPSTEDCKQILELLTHHSFYSFEEQLKQGYITVAGGHRIGLAGKTILVSGQVKMIREVGSFNIRIARDRIGIGNSLLPHVLHMANSSSYVQHTLVMSLPGQGKTTLLRDLARSLSYGQVTPFGEFSKWKSFKVGIIDERSEIAACVRGVPTFDLGPRTDVMDGCPKAEGMMMMIRSMSPEVLIVDEIGHIADVKALQAARYAGISVIASAHAANLDEAARSPVLELLIGSNMFERYVSIDRTKGTFPFVIYDRDGRQISIRNDEIRRGERSC